MVLALRVVTGAATDQSTATLVSLSGTGVLQQNVNISKVGSWVYCIGIDDNTNTLTPNANTTTIDNWNDATNNSVIAIGRRSSAATALGNTSIGWTHTSSAGETFQALEILLAGGPSTQAAAVGLVAPSSIAVGATAIGVKTGAVALVQTPTIGAAAVARAKPGTILDIGPGATQNHFQLQYAPNGSAMQYISQADIAAGFTHDPYFVTLPDNSGVQFQIQLDAQTTSGSEFPRSELREVNANDTEAAYDALQGVRRMAGDTTITHLPPLDPEVIIAQLHNGNTGDRISIRTQLVSGVTRLVVRINGTGTGLPRMSENYAVGTRFTWAIEVNEGIPSIYYNGSLLVTGPALEPNADNAATWYFKAGAYAQANETSDSPTEYVSVVHHSLDVTHVAATGSVGLLAAASLGASGSVRRSGSVALTVLPRTTVIPGQAASLVLTQTPSIAVNGRVSLRAASIGIVQTPTISIAALRTQFPIVQLVAEVWISPRGGSYKVPVLRTVYPYPAAPHNFQLAAQNILTGEWVDWELPVSEDFEYTRQLSGPTVMQGAFKPEILSVQELGLEGYGHYLHVIIDDEVRASAILLPPQYSDSSMQFSAEGFAAAPHYVVWESDLSSTSIDPLSVVRSIWNHVQSQPQSNYGVQVANTTSVKRLGEAARTETTTNQDGSTTTRDIEAKPYELKWWDAVNCGAEIDTLSGQTPFDYRERVAWNQNRTDVLFYLDLGYPRLGSPKPDLLFDEDNILEVVPIQEPEDAYASAVLVIGAGDGSDTIRGYASQASPTRVRKTHVITDKTITTTQRANAVAAQELGIRRARAFEVSEIVVAANHPNAPLGSYDIGDDISVSVWVPWLGYTYRSWYRVTSINFKPSQDRLRLGLARSDSFSYPQAG
jgi:hypothetical protein